MVTRKATYCWKLSWILLLNILHTNVDAGLAKRSARMAREVYPEIEPENDGNQAQVCIVGDLVYAIDELVPAEQPCLKCRCQPPGVQCETIKCIKKSGCKAIHRPNKCCPDYQCECHHEGKVYANGERLKTPSGGECKVCYCRGGEVQCAKVSCYIRTDCEGKTVPGQCCPKYDHCPPKEPLLGRPTPTTDSFSSSTNQEVFELWPLTNLLQNTSEESTSPTLYETQDANKIENESATVENTIKITRATQTDFTDETIKQIEQPKITIQEIIPEIKEIPITAPSHHLDIEDVVGSSNDLVITDSEPDSSEISEVFQQPPPVLRIGDKLLFLKQGELVPEKDASTPTSVITIIGAEGLQRGFEDSAEFHEVPTKIYEDDSEHSLFNNSNDLEPKASESTHILSLVKKKSIVTSTTTAKTIISTTESPEEVTSDEPATTTLNSNDTFITNTTEIIDATTSPSPIEVTTIINYEETTNRTVILVTESPEKTNFDTMVEENPAYPSIPAVMSPEHFYSNDSQQTINVKRAPEKELEISEILVSETNKTLPLNVSRNVEENITTIEAEVNITTTEETSTIPTTSKELDETSTSTEYERSMESTGETTEDSGETTTPKDDHASILSDENASVEPSDTDLETEDMLKEVTSTPNLTNDDVEIIINKTEEKDSTNPIVKDVEIMNVNNFTNLDTVIVKAEKMELPAKALEKRENSPEDQADEIFRELEAELSANTEPTQTLEEEKEESKKIFQQLLEETSTPRSTKKGDKNAETLERVTDAIAKLTLRGRKNSYDTNILGVISNFFNTQRRYDRRK